MLFRKRQPQQGRLPPRAHQPQLPLRFPVGSRVVCKFSPEGTTEWAPGTVVKHHHREPEWGPDVESADYQVQLDAWDDRKGKYTASRGTGAVIYATDDDDDDIRAAPPSDKPPIGGICWTRGHDGTVLVRTQSCVHQKFEQKTLLV